MKGVWKKLTEVLALAIKKPEIPPAIRGARALIEHLSEEEAKLELKASSLTPYRVSIPCESIATIVFKYGNRDIYKDVYKFIQT